MEAGSGRTSAYAGVEAPSKSLPAPGWQVGWLRHDAAASRAVLQRSLRALDQYRDPLAAADARRGDPPALLAAPELDQERQDEPGAGGAQRVPEADRPAVHVHPVAIQPQVLLDREILAGERLVDLEEIDVGEREPGALEHLADR